MLKSICRLLLQRTGHMWVTRPVSTAVPSGPIQGLQAEQCPFQAQSLLCVLCYSFFNLVPRIGKLIIPGSRQLKTLYLKTQSQIQNSSLGLWVEPLSSTECLLSNIQSCPPPVEPAIQKVFFFFWKLLPMSQVGCFVHFCYGHTCLDFDKLPMCSSQTRDC